MYSIIETQVVLSKKTLSYLLNKYLENPEATHDISECLADDGISDIRQIHELGGALVRRGLVKEYRFSPAGFLCRITTLGIIQVESFLSELRFSGLQGSYSDQQDSRVDLISPRPGHFRQA
jgi:hypothetical protein